MTAYFWEMRRKLATSAVCCPVRILLGGEVVTWFHCSLLFSSLLYFIGNSSRAYCCCYFCFSAFSFCFECGEWIFAPPPPISTPHTLLPLPGSRITQHLKTPPPPPQLDVYDVYICSIRMLTVYVVPHTFSVVFRRFLYCISWGSVMRWWGQWRQKIHTGV